MLIASFLYLERATRDEAEHVRAVRQESGTASLAFPAAHSCDLTCSPLTFAMSPRLFGTQVTPPTPILKVLPKIFGHSDKSVRSEGSSLAHALYQYLGPGIEPWLADLKPVQVKELKEVWDGMEKEGRGKGTLKPERMTRQQARDAEQNAAAGDGDVRDGSAAAEEGASTI
jgi:hypothetical protein